MGNTELMEDAPPIIDSVEKMLIKFPRALFEEVIAKMAERRNSPKKRKAKRRHFYSRSRKHRSPPLSPLSPSAAPPSPTSFSSLSSLSFSPSISSSFTSSSSSSSSPDTQEPDEPFVDMGFPLTLSSINALLPNVEEQQKQQRQQQEQKEQKEQKGQKEQKEGKEGKEGGEEHRPVRESKKKFYELLSSVIAGDPCPSHFENAHVDQLNDKKLKLLSKQQKREIAQSMSRRRHFPAEIITIEGKGTGVRTLRPLKQFQFICEYYGELITKTEALRREKLYAATSTTRIMSCYMYYFEHRGQEFCLDATTENGAWGIGRLINHSINGNVDTIKIVIDNIPRLAFVANRDIDAGEELAYDYGDRTSFAAFPWLKK